MIIQTDNLSKTYGVQPILHQVNLSVEKGENLGIIGPNGSGKSTLISLLSGIESPTQGHVYLNGKRMEKHPRKKLAKWLAVLQQETLPHIKFSVQEVVEMGRFPFQNWLGEEKEEKERFIESILKRMELTHLANHELHQISGGEKQRVALAKMMAQEPTLLMLDEPTTYLDIGNQIQLMDEIKLWQKTEKLTVISVLHDLNLASLYCDRLLLLYEGRVKAIGPPEEIIQANRIENVYGTRPIITEHPTENVPQIILQGKDVSEKQGELQHYVSL